MVKFMKGALLAGVATFALSSVASAQLTDAEFKCQTSVSKAGSKFVGSKSKCAGKCIANLNKGLNPGGVSECYAPYGGVTATCIADPLKGAEFKFETAIRKACDPSFKVGTDCPECYSGGDCTQEATDRVQNIENQVDSFGPAVFCEQPNSDKAENACEQNTAKSLSKLVGSVNKCYDKCNANARKALILQSACVPPASDPATSTCINTANGKAIASVNKKCGDVIPSANPDCPGPDQYPDGATWVNLVSVAISGNVPSTYCASPSGAFIN